jgi:hypothetical protein
VFDVNAGWYWYLPDDREGMIAPVSCVRWPCFALHVKRFDC